MPTVAEFSLAARRKGWLWWKCGSWEYLWMAWSAPADPSKNVMVFPWLEDLKRTEHGAVLSKDSLDLQRWKSISRETCKQKVRAQDSKDVGRMNLECVICKWDQTATCLEQVPLKTILWYIVKQTKKLQSQPCLHAMNKGLNYCTSSCLQTALAPGKSIYYQIYSR